MILNSLNLCADRVAYPKRADISAVPAAQITLRNTMRGVIMKKIELTQGKFAIVDDADFEWLNQWEWSVKKTAGLFYAVRATHKGGQTHYMHRQIMGLKKGDGKQIDHINRTGIDNRRSNLRLCDYSTNRQNSIKRRGSTSKYKGVHWYKPIKKWKSTITINKKLVFLGHYKTEEDAARVYDKKARELFGEFARLNFPEESKKK